MTDNLKVPAETSGFVKPAPEAMLRPGELDELAQKYNTDKSSLGHDYVRAYEFMLSHLRDKKFTLMELGVGIPSREAPSLRMWRDFFPYADIVGVDIRKVSKNFEGERISVEIGDASKPRFLRRIFREHTPHVILDDASHMWSHQLIGLKTLFPMLPPGGTYIVEDIHTSFWTDGEYADAPEDFVSFLQRLQADIAGGHQGTSLKTREEHNLAAWIDVILLSRKTVAISKRMMPHRKALKRGRAMPE